MGCTTVDAVHEFPDRLDPTDPEGASAAYDRAEAIVRDEAPVIPIDREQRDGKGRGGGAYYTQISSEGLATGSSIGTVTISGPAPASRAPIRPAVCPSPLSTM